MWIGLGLAVVAFVCAGVSLWQAHRAVKFARIARQASLELREWRKSNGVD